MSVLGECLVAFIFGSCVGVLMQRSRFCNAAALRDAILFKSYRNTKALLIAMMVLTIGFTAFMSIGQGHPMRFDVGLNQMIGLFIFGVGMVLAGACTVSTWVKAGEGNVGAAWALLFTFIGMFLFSLIWSANYWPPAPASMTGEPPLARMSRMVGAVRSIRLESVTSPSLTGTLISTRTRTRLPTRSMSSSVFQLILCSSVSAIRRLPYRAQAARQGGPSWQSGPRDLGSREH